MDHKGSKILVIDDMSEMGDIFRLMLSRERNDQVIFAPDGQQGLMMAQQEHPHLIILDLVMPNLDGFQVFERIKAMPDLQNIPVLLTTALFTPQFYAEAMQLGAPGYLCKPFDMQDLLAARDAMLRGETFYRC